MKDAIHAAAPTGGAALRRGTDSGRRARIAELRAYIVYAVKAGNADLRADAERELLAMGETP